MSIHMTLEATCAGLLEFMRVEEEWSIRHGDGFTWWPHHHAQHIRIERASDRRGRAILTLSVLTDLVEGFDGRREQWIALAAQMADPVVSGVVSEPGGRGRLQLASSVQSRVIGDPAAEEQLAWSAFAQAYQAERTAAALADVPGLVPLRSQHPQSGSRRAMHDRCRAFHGMLSLPGGGTEWGDKPVSPAAAVLEEASCYFVLRDADSLRARMPHPGKPLQIGIDTRPQHPVYQRGLSVLIRTPQQVGDPAQAAWLCLQRNRRDLLENRAAHFLGSWVPGDTGIEFRAFFPGWLETVLTTAEVVHTAAERARWLSEVVGGYPIDRDPEGQRDAFMRQRLRNAASSLDLDPDFEARVEAAERARRERGDD